MKINIGIGKNEWVSFVVTLLATLVGVLIALWLTNSGIRNKEKEDTIKLLNTAKLILKHTIEYSKGINISILESEKDTINYSKEDIESIKLRNPIPYPDLMKIIISNELVSKNISESSHMAIYSGLLNTKKLALYETVEYYIKYLETMIDILDLEIKLLNGDITLNELERQYQDAQPNNLEEGQFRVKKVDIRSK